jgi:hypothetical protein
MFPIFQRWCNPYKLDTDGLIDPSLLKDDDAMKPEARESSADRPPPGTSTKSKDKMTSNQKTPTESVGQHILHSLENTFHI